LKRKKEITIEDKKSEESVKVDSEIKNDEKESKSIPKDEQKNKEINEKEKESKTENRIQIVGKSHKEIENDKLSSVETKSKKRAYSEDKVDDSAKRKKTEDHQEKKEKKSQDTILINNFVRPLVTRSVKELVGQFGEVKSFWMDTIKTHAYVTYAKVEEAEAAFKGINGIKFPEETGKILSVEFLSEDESKERIKKEEEKKSGINISGAGGTSHRGRFDTLFSSSSAAARIGLSINSRRLSQVSRKSDTSPFSASPTTTISPSSIARAASQSINIIGKNKESSTTTESIAISSSPTRETYVVFEINKAVKSKVSSRSKHVNESSSSEVSFLHGNTVTKDKENSNSNKKDKDEKDKSTNKEKSHTISKTMDDLFKKTKATPVIYYRPLTEEEVKKKEQRENEERIRAREKLKEREKREEREERERKNKKSRRY